MNKERTKTYGEVLTPKSLANEMLDKLPNEAWELGKTILDPASGRNAIFPIEYFKRVVKYNIDNYDYDFISKKFWNEMMFMVELQKDANEISQNNIKFFVFTGKVDLELMYSLDPNETYKMFE